MEKRHYIGKGIFALLVAVATLAGCSKDSDSNDSPTPTPPVVEDPYKEWSTKPKIKEGETSYISFYVEDKEISGVDFNLKGNGWTDLNNNGVQDPDEKSEIFDGSDKHYTLQSRAFTVYGNITSLIATDNVLKGLDISHAPTLQEVKAGINEINALNLKENKALTKLNVYENGLSTLDLKENKALNELNVSYNQLSTLDLRENKSLTELNVANNKLSALDLKENKVLTKLYVYENTLSTLDLRENKSLNELNVVNNQLSALDLRENKSLTKLEVANNQLSALDLTKNNVLTKLNVANNQLSTLDISTDSQLKEVDLVSNKLSEEAMLKIAENLPQREEADKGTIFLQTFKIVNGKQVAENNKLNQEILDKLGVKKWIAKFINKEGYYREYNGNPNTPHENP